MGVAVGEDEAADPLRVAGDQDLRHRRRRSRCRRSSRPPGRAPRGSWRSIAAIPGGERSAPGSSPPGGRPSASPGRCSGSCARAGRRPRPRAGRRPGSRGRRRSACPRPPPGSGSVPAGSSISLRSARPLCGSSLARWRSLSCSSPHRAQLSLVVSMLTYIQYECKSRAGSDDAGRGACRGGAPRPSAPRRPAGADRRRPPPLHRDAATTAVSAEEIVARRRRHPRRPLPPLRRQGGAAGGGLRAARGGVDRAGRRASSSARSWRARWRR